MISHRAITRRHFDDVLGQYPGLLTSIPAKHGQKPLADLDRFRYVDAPSDFAGPDARREMSLDDVKSLVEWKLRHGKFRPTLMNLVSSNPPEVVSRTVRSALEVYRGEESQEVIKDDKVGIALNILTQLRGVGPATASLLLAVHDPSRVIFFSDEAFGWLCRDGDAKSVIRYVPAEYRALRGEAAALAARLGVSAMDVEKVAYVLMKRAAAASTAYASKPVKRERGLDEGTKGDAEERSAAASKPVKRGRGLDEAKGDTETHRRSKRLRKKAT